MMEPTDITVKLRILKKRAITALKHCVLYGNILIRNCVKHFLYAPMFYQ